jgi:hypothetical protein
MADMNNVRLEAIQQFGKALIYSRNAVAILIAWIVHQMQSDPRIVRVQFRSETVVGSEGVFFSGEDVNLMSICQPLAKRLAVDLRACVVSERVAMDNFEDFHATLKVIVVKFSRTTRLICPSFHVIGIL